MDIKKETWNGLPNHKGHAFSLFPILIYGKYKRLSFIQYKFEIGIFFWSIRLKWEKGI